MELRAKTKKVPFRLSATRISPQAGTGEDVHALQVLLARYGYLGGDFCPGVYDEPTRRATAQFQSFYRLYPEQDGVCDEETVHLLNEPRCGVPDHGHAARTSDGRLAPFVTVGAKWPTTQLAFRFLNSTADLPVPRQREIIRESFNRWSQASALAFREVAANQPAEFSIAFQRGSHGDGSPFDDAGGPDGNTLAHAFFPPPQGGGWAGALHFDEYETWKDQPGGPGIRLYNVALHEIGHLLGLAHSQDPNAIMYAYYAENRNDLQPDDVAGIQSLYGSPVAAPVAIRPGEKVAGYLPQVNSVLNYQLTLQDKLLVKLDGPSGQDFDLYVRFGSPVDRENSLYDAVSYGVTAEELVTIEHPKAGTYYIQVHCYQGSGSFDLQVELA